MIPRPVKESLPGPASAAVPKSSAGRLDAIDLLRGVVIVLMALDHVKGNLSNLQFDATDLTKTSWVFFLTRWVTHFCAPTFVFLAGTGAFLYGARGHGKPQLAWFLFSRGLWLVFLEVTVVRFSWYLNVSYTFTVGQVIWAIGWSMVLLSGLVFLPTAAVTVFGVALIAFHNLFDGVRAADWGSLDWLWKILHTGQVLEPLPGRQFGPFYPLIPWVGVLAAGYGFGALMLLEPRRRRKEVLGLGLALALLFVALRLSNVYGDKAAVYEGGPGPWSVQKDWLFTVFSFVNCQKYPPSLLFLLMTLGPALVALALFDRPAGPVGRLFVTFGRVPLFFYLLHWYVIKGLALGLAYLRYGRADWMYGDPPGSVLASGLAYLRDGRTDWMYGDPLPGTAPSDVGYDLWVVYVLWLAVVVFLYPFCAWFAGVKRRSRAAWLSYL